MTKKKEEEKQNKNNKVGVRQVSVGFTDRQFEMIEELKMEMAFPSTTALVQRAVVDMYRRDIKNVNNEVYDED